MCYFALKMTSIAMQGYVNPELCSSNKKNQQNGGGREKDSW
jgi:hypothetical protein